MKILSWWMKQNLTREQRTMVLHGKAKVLAKTEKAFLLQYNTKDSMTKFWCPKSVTLTRNPDYKKTEETEYGEMLWFARRNKVVGVDIGCGLDINEIRERVIKAGYKKERIRWLRNG